MDNNLELLIDMVIKLSHNPDKYEILREEGTFFWIYPFTTENIAGYINMFDLKNKSLLTVGSSGDQAINAILRGCEDVTIIDINPFAKYYFYLKKAAILTLNYKEFLDFFCYRFYNDSNSNEKTFNLNSYNKLKDTLKELDEESFIFWDTVFAKCNRKDVRNQLFKTDETGVRVLKEVNPYLRNKYSFTKAKIKIGNINPKFIRGNIFKTKLHRTYDNVFLSNIGAYNTQKDLKGLVDRLAPMLNNEGKILICYLYDTIKDTKYCSVFPEIYDLEKFFKIFKKYITEFNSFQGISNIRFYDRAIKDSVVIYQKDSKKKRKR